MTGGFATGEPTRPGGPLVILCADDLARTQHRLKSVGAVDNLLCITCRYFLVSATCLAVVSLAATRTHNVFFKWFFSEVLGRRLLSGF